jgi:hypothetical protein
VNDKKCLEARLQLFAGLYDGPREGVPETGSYTPPGGQRDRIRVLNPTITDGDATARRFAMLEID